MCIVIIMNRLNVGDSVEVIGGSLAYRFRIGTVTDVSDDGPYVMVQFDNCSDSQEFDAIDLHNLRK